jgi:signal transduction histidine kinase
MEKALRQRTAELEILSARDKAIVASARIAVISTDLQGHITSFNPAAEAMFHCTAQQVLGRLVTDFCEPDELTDKAQFFPPDVQAEAAGMPAALIAGMLPEQVRAQTLRNECTCMRDDGTSFPGLLHLSVLRDTQEQALGFLVLLTDLTERKALEEQLRERTRQAEVANAAKTAFLATMSHEFRTPLNAVIGLSQVLQQKPLPTDVARLIGHIHQAGEQLLALVNDVLDLSRIEAGKMQLESVAFEPLALLDAVLEMVRPQADAKGLSLVADVAPELPPRLVGDPLRLRQVLLNLLSNAVKFTPAGSVTLRARVLAHGAAQVLLCLDVIDTGIGITAQQQSRIFDAFTQADASTTRRFGGSGLGLSIVCRLVHMMDGTLSVQSQPGQGSVFSVKLPFPTG